MTTVVVMAKECTPGRVKTRLHPPYTLEQAAMIAAASLDDTLAFVAGLAVGRRVLCFEGSDIPATAHGFEVVPQATGPLDERIAAVLDHCDGPTIVIGMDTPQLRADDLGEAVGEWPDGVDAFLGAAADGGFWSLALREPRGDLVRGVTMSRADTGLRQRARLTQAGLRVADLPVHTDIDTVEALEHVMGQLRGHSRLRKVVRAVEREMS